MITLDDLTKALDHLVQGREQVSLALQCITENECHNSPLGEYVAHMLEAYDTDMLSVMQMELPAAAKEVTTIKRSAEQIGKDIAKFLEEGSGGGGITPAKSLTVQELAEKMEGDMRIKVGDQTVGQFSIGETVFYSGHATITTPTDDKEYKVLLTAFPVVVEDEVLTTENKLLYQVASVKTGEQPDPSDPWHIQYIKYAWLQDVSPIHLNRNKVGETRIGKLEEVK